MGNVRRVRRRGELETAFSVAAAQKVIAGAGRGTVPEGEFITALAGIARRQFAEGRFPTLSPSSTTRLPGIRC